MKMIGAEAQVEESVHAWEHLDPWFYPRQLTFAPMTAHP